MWQYAAESVQHRVSRYDAPAVTWCWYVSGEATLNRALRPGIRGVAYVYPRRTDRSSVNWYCAPSAAENTSFQPSPVAAPVGSNPALRTPLMSRKLRYRTSVARVSRSTPVNAAPADTIKGDSNRSRSARGRPNSSAALNRNGSNHWGLRTAAPNRQASEAT